MQPRASTSSIRACRIWKQDTGHPGWNFRRGAFAPVIVAPHIRMEGAAPLPVPYPATAAAAASGVLDSRYVSVEGVVHPLKFGDNPHHRVVTFDLETAAGRLHVSTAPTFADRLHAENLDDAGVRIRGVFETIYNSRRQILGDQLQVAAPSDIEVLEPTVPDPFRMETTPVEPCCATLRTRERGTG